MSILRGEKLVKIYGRRKVVDNVHIEVSQGEIVGLLGPNGAGKTTSFYMVTGMIRLRLTRSTCRQSIAAISPLLIAVSMAQLKIGT